MEDSKKADDGRMIRFRFMSGTPEELLSDKVSEIMEARGAEDRATREREAAARSATREAAWNVPVAPKEPDAIASMRKIVAHHDAMVAALESWRTFLHCAHENELKLDDAGAHAEELAAQDTRALKWMRSIAAAAKRFDREVVAQASTTRGLTSAKLQSLAEAVANDSDALAIRAVEAYLSTRDEMDRRVAEGVVARHREQHFGIVGDVNLAELESTADAHRESTHGSSGRKARLIVDYAAGMAPTTRVRERLKKQSTKAKSAKKR